MTQRHTHTHNAGVHYQSVQCKWIILPQWRNPHPCWTSHRQAPWKIQNVKSSTTNTKRANNLKPHPCLAPTSTHWAPSEQAVDKGFSSLALLSLFNKKDSHAASALAKQWRKDSFHRWATIPENLLTRAEIFNLFFFLFNGKVGLSSACWLYFSLSQRAAGTSRWFA